MGKYKWGQSSSATLATIPATGSRGKFTPPTKVLTTFQSGHGFVQYTDTPAYDLNATTSPYKGTQYAWARTSGAGLALAGLERTTLAQAISASAHYLRVIFRVQNRSNLKELAVWLFTGGGTSNYVRVYLHSSQGQWPYRDNEWVTLDVPIGTLPYSVTGDYHISGSPDLSNITGVRVRVQDGQVGGSGPVTVGINEISFIPKRSPTISFTFDDQDISVYTTAKPIMDRYGFVGSNFIIAETVGSSGKMSLSQLKTLTNQGWDACGHAYASRIHGLRPTDVPPSVLSQDCIQLKRYLTTHFGRGHNIYAYPGGDFDDGVNDVRPIISEHFEFGRSIMTRWTEVNPACDSRTLRVMYVTNTTTLAAATEKITNMVAAGAMIIPVFHKLVPGAPSQSTEWRASDFDTLCANISAMSSSVEVLPLSTVLARTKT